MKLNPPSLLRSFLSALLTTSVLVLPHLEAVAARTLLEEKVVEAEWTHLLQLVVRSTGEEPLRLHSEFEMRADGSLSWLDQYWADGRNVEVFTTDGFGNEVYVQNATSARGDLLAEFDYNRGQHGIITLAQGDLEYYLESITYYVSIEQITTIVPLRLDEPVPGNLSPFWNFPHAENGWRHTNWGWLNDTDAPWVFHLSLGWLHVSPLYPQGHPPLPIAFHPTKGWIYFWSPDYRYIYAFGEDAWYWLDESTGNLLVIPE